MSASPQLPFAALVAQWPEVAVRRLARLDTPLAIAAYLDQLDDTEDAPVRSPLSVLRDRCCNPLDAGLLAAAALRQLGVHPQLHAVCAGDLWATLAYATWAGTAVTLGGRPWRSLPRQRGLMISNYDALDWMTEDSGANSVVEAALQLAGYRPK